MSALTNIDAEEFSQSLEQIGEGWFRQLALGIKLRVPEALGLTRREWSDRIGLKVRGRADRVNIETELSTEGLSNRAIADVLGVASKTVDRDLAASNDAPEEHAREEEEDTGASFDAPHWVINRESPAVKAMREHDKRAFNESVHELCCCIAFLEWFGEQPHDDEVDSWGGLFEISKRLRHVVVTHCRLFPGNARLTDLLKVAGGLCVETAQGLRAAKRLLRERAP